MGWREANEDLVGKNCILERKVQKDRARASRPSCRRPLDRGGQVCERELLKAVRKRRSGVLPGDHTDVSPRSQSKQ